MKKENSIENSMFYKNNKKIQNNLWKVYTLGLIVSIAVVAIKGIN